MSRVRELFGHSTADAAAKWTDRVSKQLCPFVDKKCFKVRKSNPAVSIGTCTVGAGKAEAPLIICPNRFLEKNRIFMDSMHLLTQHEPGNDLHVVPETSVPGGSVDHFLVSVRRGKVKDFVGIEIQALDTTGTVWPQRERFLASKGLPHDIEAVSSLSPFGINWKMTAKTILVQLHHKVETFEHVGKKLVLACQDALMKYMEREFSFAHIAQDARLGDSMHFHSYALHDRGAHLTMELDARFSTDAEGVAKCLGLQTEAKVELEEIVSKLQAAISPANRLAIR